MGERPPRRCLLSVLCSLLSPWPQGGSLIRRWVSAGAPTDTIAIFPVNLVSELEGRWNSLPRESLGSREGHCWCPVWHRWGGEVACLGEPHHAPSEQGSHGAQSQDTPYCSGTEDLKSTLPQSLGRWAPARCHQWEGPHSNTELAMKIAARYLSVRTRQTGVSPRKLLCSCECKHSNI